MKEIYLLPPFAIARVGSAEDPVINFKFELQESAQGEPSRHQIVPAETIFIDRSTGKITEIRVPGADELTFKDQQDHAKVKPVVPFLELWAEFEGEDEIRIVTQEDLDAAGLEVSWSIKLANWKAARRTEDKGDRIEALLVDHPHGDTSPKALAGVTANSAYHLPGRSILFGHFQPIRIDDTHREIRARFIPPEGLIYGPEATGDDQIIPFYSNQTPWIGYDDNANPDGTPRPFDRFPPPTVPWLTYAGEEIVNGRSRGLIDDMSDGTITVAVTGPGVEKTAQARIAVGPTDFAPDRFQFRSLADDFAYLEYGARVEEVVPDQEVVDLVEHAFDNAEAIQLEWAKVQSAWRRFSGPNVNPRPDDGRDIHLDLLSDGRELTAGNATGAFANREQFVDYIREPASLEGGRKMPLFMSGQNRAPLWISPLQYARLLKWKDQSVGEVPSPVPDGTVDAAQAKENMLALIRKKRDDENAARRHRRVDVSDTETLEDLFADEERLLDFLLTAKAIDNPIPGMEDLPLITPGDPEKSAFYLMIVDPENGVMNGRFDDEEIQIIKQWIESLS